MVLSDPSELIMLVSDLIASVWSAGFAASSVFASSNTLSLLACFHSESRA